MAPPHQPRGLWKTVIDPKGATDMSDPRIIDLTLDERTILWRSDDIENERRIAITDLLANRERAARRQQQQPGGRA